MSRCLRWWVGGRLTTARWTCTDNPHTQSTQWSAALLIPARRCCHVTSRAPRLPLVTSRVTTWSGLVSSTTVHECELSLAPPLVLMSAATAPQTAPGHPPSSSTSSSRPAALSRLSSSVDTDGSSRSPTCAAASTSSSSPPPPQDRLPSADQLSQLEAMLIEDLNTFFSGRLNLSIYDGGIVFDNRIRGTRTVGLLSYSRQCALLRIVGNLRFGRVQMEVLQSTTHVHDGTVRVRWRMLAVGTCRFLLGFLQTFSVAKTVEKVGFNWYDGYSVFHVNSQGLIHMHIADKMMPDWDGADAPLTSRLASRVSSSAATAVTCGASVGLDATTAWTQLTTVV